MHLNGPGRAEVLSGRAGPGRAGNFRPVQSSNVDYSFTTKRHKWELVSEILFGLGLGRLNIKHLIMLRNVQFYCFIDICFITVLRFM